MTRFSLSRIVLRSLPYTLSAGLIGGLVACTTPIEFKQEISRPMMVMSAVAVPDSILTVELSESRFFLGEEKPFNVITGAQVDLYVNGAFEERLDSVAPGRYASTYRCRVGDELSLEASEEAQGYRVSSRQTVEAAPLHLALIDSMVQLGTEPQLDHTMYRMDTLHWRAEPFDAFRYDHQITLAFSFDDEAGRRDYYYIVPRLILKWPNPYSPQTVLWPKQYRMDISPVSDLIDLEGDLTFMSSNGNYTLLEDRFFDGQTVTVTFSLTLSDVFLATQDEDGAWVQGEAVQGSNFWMYFEVRRLSAEWYKFLTTGAQAENNVLLSLFSEPVQVYSNIEGGIGIFGSFAPALRTVNIVTPAYRDDQPWIDSFNRYE